MKKILASILLIFMLVPFAFITAACDLSIGSNDNYDKEANIETFQTAMDSLENLGDNYTLVTEFKSSEELNKLAGFDLSKLAKASIERDGDNIHFLTAMDEFYLADGVEYKRYRNDDNTTWSKFRIDDSNKQVNDVIKEYTDFALLQDVNFETLLNFAYKTNPKAVTTTVTENGTIVSINVDLDAVLNKFISILKENKNQPISILLDDLFAEFGYEDLTVAGVINEVKTVVTPNTTIGQILDYVKTRTGIDFEALVESAQYENSYTRHYGSLWRYGIDDTNIGVRDYQVVSDNLLGISVEALEEIKGLTISQVLGGEISKVQMDAYIDSIFATVSSPTYTLSNLIAPMLPSMGDGVTAEDVFGYLDMLTIDTLHIDVDILTTNNQVAKITLGADMGITLKTGGVEVSTAFGIEGSVYVLKVGTTNINLPINLPIGDIYTTIVVDSLNSDGALPLSNVTFTGATDFVIENRMSYNAKTGMLVLSEELMVAFANYREEYPDVNTIEVWFNANGITYHLSILEK